MLTFYSKLLTRPLSEGASWAKMNTVNSKCFYIRSQYCTTKKSQHVLAVVITLSAESKTKKTKQKHGSNMIISHFLRSFRVENLLLLWGAAISFSLWSCRKEVKIRVFKKDTTTLVTHWVNMNKVFIIFDINQGDKEFVIFLPTIDECWY